MAGLSGAGVRDICKRVTRMQRVVVALGGGTPRYAWNRDALRGTAITILLEADLGVLADRVRQADRPRVNPGVSLVHLALLVVGPRIRERHRPSSTPAVSPRESCCRAVDRVVRRNR